MRGLGGGSTRTRKSLALPSSPLGAWWRSAASYEDLGSRIAERGAPANAGNPSRGVAALCVGGELRMNARNKITSGGLVLVGRLVGSALSGIAALVITCLILVGIGIFRFETVQIITMKPYDPVRRSFNILGHVFEQGEVAYRILCVVFLLPSVAAAFLVWTHLGRRWRTREQ